MTESEPAECTHGKIFVGSLPFQASSEDVSKLFSRFGEVIGVNLRRDRNTGKLKGFGFVTFSTKESSEEAINVMNGYVFMGRQLTVNHADKRGSPSSPDPNAAWKTVPSPSKGTSKPKTGTGIRTETNPRSWSSWASPTS